MSSPTLRADWDEARLDAAFRTLFSGAIPPDLGERIHGGLVGVRPQSTFRLSPLAAGLAAALAIVAVVVVGSNLPNVGPGRTATPAPVTTPAPTSSAPQPSATTGSTHVPFPSQVTVGVTNVVLPVISVSDALQIRGRGADSSEIAVSGWFVKNVVPCPERPGATTSLEQCIADFTWLMAAPEQLSTTDATGAGSVHAPTGPAFNVSGVFQPAEPGVAEPVVLIGHFDDAQAATCLPADRRLCADRFVLDQVAWTTGSLPDGVPGYLGDLVVISVNDAIALRESHESLEVAVAGWYQIRAVPFCGVAPAPVGPILGGCPLLVQYLGADPASITPKDALVVPPGPAINVAFDGIPRPSVEQYGEKPFEAVFIGHFADPRWILCPKDHRAECRGRFVVDAIAWVGGTTASLPVANDEAAGHAVTSSQQASLDAFLRPSSMTTVISTVTVLGSHVDVLEPGITSSTSIDVSGVVVIVHGYDNLNNPHGSQTFAIDPAGAVWSSGPSWLRTSLP